MSIEIPPELRARHRVRESVTGWIEWRKDGETYWMGTSDGLRVRPDALEHARLFCLQHITGQIPASAPGVMH